MRILLLIAILVLGLATAPSRAGLLAYYPFDDGFLDVSGNGNHLSVGAGSPAITEVAGESAFGRGALDIESSTSSQEYLDLAAPIQFAPGDAWSIIFWARHRPGNDGRTGMIVGDLTSANFIWIPRDGAVAGLRFRNSSGQNADYTTPPAGVEDAGVYHHFAVVADGTGEVEIYYDNASLGVRAIATAFNITSVAQAFNQATQSMNGQIDELYIYDEAIGPERINELFTGAGGPDSTSPAITGAAIVDDRGGAPLAPHSPVTYTLTFSEDMDAATVTPEAFGNVGTAPISIGPIVEVSPGVFSVQITPQGLGTLQLGILAGAALADPAGNLLDTDAAIADDTVLLVEEGIGPPAVRRLRVYLVGGQSNAAGRGDPSGLPTSPVDLQLPQEDVDYFYGTTLTTLRPLALFGPEITLGRRLSDSLADEATRVAIIKYGSGGTSLKTDWRAGGDATTSGDGPEYATFQQVVTLGLAALSSAYPSAAIDLGGMVWVQGERDARNLDHGEYAANLIAFIADVRDTYAARLPFVIVRLSSGQTNLPADGLDGVRAAQTAVSQMDPDAPLVVSDSFDLLSDALHFSALGQQQIGDASAEGLLHLLPFTSAPALELAAGDNLRLTVADAFPGFFYTLQGNPMLAHGVWTDLESVEAAGDTVVFTIPRQAAQCRGFFRIQRSPGP